MSKIQAVVCILFIFSAVCFAQDTSYINILQNALSLLQGFNGDNLDFTALANLLSQINQTTVLQSLTSVLAQNRNSDSNSTRLFDLSGLPQILGSLSSIPNANEIITNLLKSGNFSSRISNITNMLSTNLPQILGSLSNIPNATEIISNFMTSGDLPSGLSNITNLLTTIFGNNDQISSGLLNSNSAFQTLVGILSSSPQSPYQISKTCSEHMIQMMFALMGGQNMWALKMVDSMGKIPIGILEGNLKALGSFDECRRVTASIFDSRTNQTISPFDGKYCTVSVPLTSLLGGLVGQDLGEFAYYYTTLTSGLCVPDSCSNSDVLIAVNQAIYQIKSLIPNAANVSIYAIQANCHENERELDDKAIGALVLCGFFAALMAIGTAYDVIYIQWPKRKNKPEGKNIDQKDNTGMGGFAAFKPGKNAPELNYKLNYPSPYLPMENEDSTQTPPAASAPPMENNSPKPVSKQPVVEQPGIAGKLILSFSVYTNGKKILNTEQGAGTITAINGIRFLSMSWVILGHTYAFIFPALENMMITYTDLLNRWTFHAIANALISVDTFFALSGFLMSYLILKELKKKKGVCGINWGLFYFHRFWRLTPAYMLILFVYVTTFPYWTDGPMWPKDGLEIDYCKDTWWTNLLYINNVFRSDKMCFGWSWYLANDMQFYVLSPLLFIPLFYNAFIGVIVCGVFLIGTTVAAGVVSTVNRLPPTSFGGVENGADVMTYMDTYYFKPYCRMGPYVVGILAGYLLYKTKCKLRIHWIVNISIWIVTTGVGLAILYGLYDPLRGKNLLSVEVSALYNATHRTAWGMCVCWVIIACATGNGGFVNTLLSWKGFIPLARLTYCAYLVHPCLMYFYYYGVRNPIYITDHSAIYLFFGHLVASYLVGFVLSLAFESPMMGMEKVIFGRVGSKKKKTKANNETPQVVKTIS